MAGGLPWFKAYPIDRDARALALAGKLGRPNAWIHIAALRYWLADKAPTGIIAGPNAQEVIEGAACWDGERGLFFQAAITSGFLGSWDAGDGVTAYVDTEWREQNAAHVAKVERDRKKPKGGQNPPADPATTPPEPLPNPPRTPHGADADVERGPHGVRTGSARDDENPHGVRTGSARGFEGESRELRVESREVREERGDLSPLPPGGGEDGGAQAGALRAPMQQALLSASSPPAPTPEDLRALWNKLAGPKGLSKWEGMSDARRNAARLHLKACPDLERWEVFLASRLEDPFNLGENDRGWRADVDWFLRAKMRDQVKDFDPTAKRPQRLPSIHSTAVSDWSEERKKHGEAPRTISDAEIVEAMERARKAGSR